MVIKLLVSLFQMITKIVFVLKFKKKNKLIDVLNRIRSLTIRRPEPNRRGILHEKWHS